MSGEGAVDGSIVVGGGGDGDGGNDFVSSIPESFRDKPYMKDIDSMDKLFEQFDNSQKLIGKKTVGIPGQESTIDEWNEFYNKMGRPESPDKYEFDSIEGFPEEVKRTDEQVAELRKIFHETGLTASQAKSLLKRIDESTKSMYEQNKADYEKMVETRKAEFRDKINKHFGSDAEKAIQVTEGLLSKYVPKGLEDAVKALDDDSLLVLASVLNNMRSESLKEDTLFKSGDGAPGQTAEDLRADAKKKMMSPEWNDVMHPNHDKVKAEVRAIYQKIASKG